MAYTLLHKYRYGTKRQRLCRTVKAKARKFLRYNMLKIILVGMLLTGIFIGVKAAAYAQSVKINDYGRQVAYKAYTVREGDTVWGIASDLAALNPEYSDIRQYVAAIEKINKLHGGKIESGRIILIPYYVNADGKVKHDDIYSKYGIGE